MRTLNVQALISLILVGTTTSTLCPAASPALGLAVAKGSFHLEDSIIWNNATVFDGSTVTSDATPLRLKLNSGTQMRMANASKATVYGNHAVLVKGAARFEGMSHFTVEASNLRISSPAADSVVWVERKGPNQLVVSADKGPVLVATAAGAPVANVPAGSTISLEGQAADPTAPYRATGCLIVRDGAYVLKGGPSNIYIELRGYGLERNVGKSVEVSGQFIAAATSPVKGITQVLDVATLNVVSSGCPLSKRDAVAGWWIAGATVTAVTLAIVLGGEGKSSNSR